MSDQELNSLPRFDARDYEPPQWATSSRFDWGRSKHGQSSKTSTNVNGAVSSDGPGDVDEEDEDDIFVDASEGESLLDPDEVKFSNEELKELLDKATALKTEGNRLFTSKPPDHGAAIDAYKSALKFLPPCPKKVDKAKVTVPPPPSGTSGIQEVTDEEATAIEAEQKASEIKDADKVEKERDQLEEEIRECTKACWGNQAASFIALGDDKEAIRACSRALEIDSLYIKALQRRAAANDRLGTWSSLTAAQDDYKLVLTLVPQSSTQAAQCRRALLTLSDRIRIQQDKEKDEMLGKLKELGDGLLGKFGMSTDMFKFDQQEGGGYNVRFER